jgi:thioredoxin-dependent peroxiredoxin
MESRNPVIAHTHLDQHGASAGLRPGDRAPAFELPDADLNVVRLVDVCGSSHLVLYFYPKDDTPGCTAEALEFSELEMDYRDAGALVLGISRDDCMAHGAFRDKHGLAVQLLSDVDGDVCRSYGVMQHKEYDGQTRECIRRSTFVIDRKGVVRHALYGVSPRGHAAEVLQLIKEL